MGYGQLVSTIATPEPSSSDYHCKEDKLRSDALPKSVMIELRYEECSRSFAVEVSGRHADHGHLLMMAGAWQGGIVQPPTQI